MAHTTSFHIPEKTKIILVFQRRNLIQEMGRKAGKRAKKKTPQNTGRLPRYFSSEEATTTPRLEGQRGQGHVQSPCSLYADLLSRLEHLLPPREPQPLLPRRKPGLPLLLQSGSLKSRGPVVVTARAGVHECHAAEVAIVTVMAPTLEEYCLGRNPGACTHPLFLLLPLLEKGKKASPSAFQSPTRASHWQNLMGSQRTKKSEKSFQPLAIQRTA